MNNFLMKKMSEPYRVYDGRTFPGEKELCQLCIELAAEIEILQKKLNDTKAAVWKPIETAPRDKTKVFLWLPKIEGKQDARMIMSYWDGQFWTNKYGNGPAYNVTFIPAPSTEYYVADRTIILPSHWMPIPAPPDTP